MLSGRLAVILHWMLELLFSPTGVVVALMSLTRCPGRLVDHDLTIFL